MVLQFKESSSTFVTLSATVTHLVILFVVRVKAIGCY